MRLFTSILAITVAISLQAQDNSVTKELTKYTDLKNDLYIKKIKAKRDLTAENRDTRDLIRDYEARRVYASIRK